MAEHVESVDLSHKVPSPHDVRSNNFKQERQLHIRPFSECSV